MDEITHKKNKIYYSIGEVAEMFDVNASLIRFWEKKFDIIKPHKNKKGNRMFTPKDVDNFKLIYHLVKERGMTLAGAEQRLKNNKSGESHNMEIVDRLLSIRSMLVEIREELKQEGEIFTPEGYLDEDYTDDMGAIGASTIKVEADNADMPDQEELIIITEEVRTEVVTDGSSPWDEGEEEEGRPAYEEEDDSEPVDETQRSAAMQELRSVKDILDGWNDFTESQPGTTNEEAQETRQQAASNTDHGADFAARTWPEITAQPSRSSSMGHEIGAGATNDLGGLGNIFDDGLDSNGDYSDPWEDVGDNTLIEDPHDPFSYPGPGNAGIHTDTEADTPKPGAVFGTDACTTFSPDDSEAATENGMTAQLEEVPAVTGHEEWEEAEPAKAQEPEEPKKPLIYEQTLF